MSEARSPTVILSSDQCEFCGADHHDGICPMVQAVEYYPSGARKRVEFKASNLDNAGRPWPRTSDRPYPPTSDFKTR